MGEVSQYISEALATQPEVYGSSEEFLVANPGYEEAVSRSLSPDEKSAVKDYSGFRFAWINSVARGIWDYDKLGRKTPELEEEIKDSTRKIISAIEKAPKAEHDFMTFRGTDLSGFRAYGVEKVSDLANMRGQFMLEQGFTSTAIAREQNFAERGVQSLWINSSNVEMRYHIPKGAGDFIALSSDELSYSPQQTEVLIDHDSLFFINDVNVDKEDHAVVDAILIPLSVYDH